MHILRCFSASAIFANEIIDSPPFRYINILCAWNHPLQISARYCWEAGVIQGATSPLADQDYDLAPNPDVCRNDFNWNLSIHFLLSSLEIRTEEVLKFMEFYY